MMTRMRSKKGFTLVEIMIVVSVIGLLASIAIPSFVKARATAEKNACIANIKRLYSAQTMWATDTGNIWQTCVSIPTAQLVPNYLKSWPKCGTVDFYQVQCHALYMACPRMLADHTL